MRELTAPQADDLDELVSERGCATRPLILTSNWAPSNWCVLLPQGGPPAYTETMPEPRIVADHRIMGGVPCIRGTRIPVATVVGLFAQGRSVEEILADYPQVSAEDVRAALEFAAAAVSERQVPLRTPA